MASRSYVVPVKTADGSMLLFGESRKHLYFAVMIRTSADFDIVSLGLR